jgi:ribonuclease T1
LVPGSRLLARTIALALLGFWLVMTSGSALARTVVGDSPAVVREIDLPEQARETLALIRQGGPHPFARDGAVFANREGRLPPAPRGTYREYTVKTPGRRDRGARRIIAAPDSQFWYTADHYRSFTRIVQ